MELTVLAVSFGLLLLIGVPVGFAVGLSSVATIIAAGLPVAVVFQKMVGGMQVFSFLAIPFFIFAGELMLHGGIAQRIVRFANSLVGHVRGGLGMSNVLGCTIFGGVAGSPAGRRIGHGLGDDSADEEGGLRHRLRRQRHHPCVPGGRVDAHQPQPDHLYTLATAGIASVSVLGMILACVIPALLPTVLNMLAAYGVAIQRGYPTRGRVCRLGRSGYEPWWARCRAC